ncbi:hypothetical protein IGI04_023330 [Brassica rapa subsp. trilocularis]|uniref:Uncharacterized protein n=1 Tax=Brassica rapa subsp. trilocularis TaxID=1813537 RepID=A0ABQ7M3J7_BRACM|nr:hypothetical protein IGI04_023330 [Brassica rapa subsp. trilocularis]
MPSFKYQSVEILSKLRRIEWWCFIKDDKGHSQGYLTMKTRSISETQLFYPKMGTSQPEITRFKSTDKHQREGHFAVNRLHNNLRSPEQSMAGTL